MIIAGTGHRPDKLGGYSDGVRVKVYGLAIKFLTEARPDQVISGMALGWDQALAKAAIVLGIPLYAAVPFSGQESAWPLESQDAYHRILDQCDRVVIVTPGGYAPVKMQLRNQWMVDQCDLLAALWDGTDGGTHNCVKYAKAIRKPLRNLWPERH